MSDISEVNFLNFYFLNVDISLIIYAINLKCCIHIKNIIAEGTVSQILYIGTGSYCMNFRKNIQKNNKKEKQKMKSKI